MSDDNYTQIVSEAKKLTGMFSALIAVTDRLGELGDLQRAEAEARQAAKKAQGELDVLRNETSRGYQRVRDAVEAEVRFQHSEGEKLLAEVPALRATVENLRAKETELRTRISDLERKAMQAETRANDATGKLGALRASLDR
jgi:uncharacterized protein (DUF3084 family)